MQDAPTTQTTAPAIPAARQAPTATEMYEAARLARSELRNQVDELQGERRRVQEQLRSATNPADIKGQEGRLVAIDARIADVEKQLAAADAMVANRAAIPGVVVAPPQSRSGPDPEEMAAMGLVFSAVLLLPLSIAYARRLWRRGGQVQPALPADLGDRITNIERGVEAVAIEVERLGEGQRFVTQLLAEADYRRQLQALPAEQRPGREL